MDNLNLLRTLTLEELGVLETELLKKRKSKEIVWGLWAGLHFFGAHRFYTENYLYASIMFATTIVPTLGIILLAVYTDIEAFSYFLLWLSICLLSGSLLWSWIDAFFLNKRIETMNHEQERNVIYRIKGLSENE
ncbi:hypothetical protein GCM10008018_35890 [Paenibacillus marchantiophytorum]|uniref:TM2 domain-containing protein n=1 Tax=Paenibacillus marchantiophytorum TaxID=1619310 RepID=A0ABQ1EUK0_9BACL|nr:hypothetical protein GCM10008018_35890 [Paenibacillus marchantiophytorum]